MKIFSSDYLDELTEQARSSLRLRQHRNVHQHYHEPCQRLFNAIEPSSYIRPHRHASDPRDEMLIAIRGLLALITFDDEGAITSVVKFGTEKFGTNISYALEVPSSVWHTVVALESGSVLLEIKAGPFDPNQPKDLAGWSPAESSADARDYLETLIRTIGRVPPGVTMDSGRQCEVRRS